MQTNPFKGTTSVGLVREAIHGAIQRGIDISPALDSAGIDPQLLNAPHARVPADAFSKLWVALADLLDDEFFAIDSHPMRRGSFKILCQAALGSDTLAQALRRILSFLRLILDDVYGELRYEGEDALIVIHDHGTERRLFCYGTWLILVHGLLCWLANRRIPLKELAFRPGRPNDDSDYRARFCDNLVFDAPQTLARLDREYLALKIAQTPAGIPGFMRDSPAALLVRFRNDDSVSIQIRRRLKGIVPWSWPELDSLATMMSMSSSTLQRRLASEGLSYQRVKDNLRRDMAINLLSQPGVTVSDVAAQIGFQETSAFHRAFKKWTGINPGAYRRVRPE